MFARLFLFVSLGALVGLSNANGVLRRGRTGCASVTARQSSFLVYWLRQRISNETFRTRYALPAVSDTAQIQAVSDSLRCQRAAVTMNRYHLDPDSTPRQPNLVSVGNRYWAEDTTLRTSGLLITLVLDSSLTKVLATGNR